MNNLPSWQYIAGFFDGEGSLLAYLSDYGNPYVKVTIPQKDRHILDLIQTVVGGKVYHIKSSPSKIYQLHLSKPGEVIAFLDGIEPYTLRRKERLTLVRAMAQLVGDGKKQSDREVYQRLLLYENFLSLKDTPER